MIDIPIYVRLHYFLSNAEIFLMLISILHIQYLFTEDKNYSENVDSFSMKMFTNLWMNET